MKEWNTEEKSDTSGIRSVYFIQEEDERQKPLQRGEQEREVTPEENKQPVYPTTYLSQQQIVPNHIIQPTKINSPPQPVPEKRKMGRTLGFVAALVICTLLSGFLGGYLGAKKMENSIAQQTATIETGKQTEQSLPSDATEVKPAENTADIPSVADVVEQAAPSVVAIDTSVLTQNIYGQIGSLPASGSGVIIREDGYILTNAHVVEGATKINVTLASGETLMAEMVGADPANDLAVIKVRAKDLPAIPVAGSADLRAGDPVIAIGNPFGVLSGTVTTGIISSVNRNVEVGNQVLYNVLQIDAPINSGNSGGALLNRKGELIGINSAKAGGDTIEGIAFAIPIDTALPIATQLIETGKVNSPEVGISGAAVSADLQQAYELPPGVLIQSVKPGSAAAQAGLEKADIITKFAGQSVFRVQDITALKNRLKPNTEVEVEYWRNGETKTTTLVLQKNN